MFLCFHSIMANPSNFRFNLQGDSNREAEGPIRDYITDILVLNFSNM